MHASESYGLFVPQVDPARCDNCGLCLKVCPGQEPPAAAICVEHEQEESAALGPFTAVWSGYAMDEALRYRASSGGLVTAILLQLMAHSEIDGAIVTLPGDGPFRWEGRVARDEKSVREAMGSKYYPTHVAPGLRQVLEVEGRYAFVGLPCQVQGLRKAQQHLPLLRSRVPIVLSLFCNHVPTFASAKYLLRKARMSRQDVLSIAFRGYGWPGGVRMTARDGRAVAFPHFGLWSGLLGLLFIHRRCLLCDDHAGMYADISCGDAWLPDHSDDELGRSIAVARTAVGEGLLSRLVPRVLYLESVQATAVERVGIRRQRGLAARVALASSAAWRCHGCRDARRGYAGGCETPVLNACCMAAA